MRRNRVLYLDIADKIKESIFSEEYPVGNLLPTENEFEKIFGVSKITIRKAIDLLVSEELVEKKSGRGTTVLSNRPYNKLSRAASFTQILKNNNLKVEKQVLKFYVVDIEEEKILYKHFGKKAVLLERVYLLENKPYIYFKHYLPVTLSDLDKEKFVDESLYRLLKQKGYEINRFSDDFIAISLDDSEKKILNTTNSIAMKRIRKSLDDEGNIIEYSEGIYDTSQHPYHVDYET